MNSSDGFFENASKMFQELQRGSGRERAARALPEVELSFDEAYTGAQREFEGVNGRSLTVRVPAGIEDGRVFRLHTPEGAVYVRVRVRTDPRFGRRGRDLSTVLQVPRSLLEQGGDAATPLAGGGYITIRIPAGTRPETCLRVQGKGMPDLNGGAPGDLYIYVRTDS